MTGHIGPVAIVFVAALFAGCSFSLPERSPVPPLQITEVAIRRSEAERFRYELTLGVHNRSEEPLRAVEFRATAEVTVPNRDEPVREAIVLSIREEIAGESWNSLRFLFDSPFSFVPPVPIRLTNIAVHAFDGRVPYPWPVEEEQ